MSKSRLKLQEKYQIYSKFSFFQWHTDIVYNDNMNIQTYFSLANQKWRCQVLFRASKFKTNKMMKVDANFSA